MSNPNRHKRQRSAAQNTSFHFPEPSRAVPYSLVPAQPSGPENSAPSSASRIPSGFHPPRPQPGPASDSSSQLRTSLGPQAPYYAPQMFQLSAFQFPQPGHDEHVFPSHEGYYQPELTNLYVRPQHMDPSHTKNISISSHLDMFTMTEPLEGSLSSQRKPEASLQPLFNPTFAYPPQQPQLQQASLPHLQKHHLRPQLPLGQEHDFRRRSRDHLQYQEHLQQPPQTLHDIPQHSLFQPFDPGIEPEAAGTPDKSVLSLTTTTLDRFLPHLAQVDAFNFNTFLLRLLREIRPTIPLDNFYNVLYNYESYGAYSAYEQLKKIDRSVPMGPITESIELYHRILEIFKDPQLLARQIPSFNLQETKLTSINFHELLRSFLASKILIDSLTEVSVTDNSQELPTLPRLSIYKVYYILCQKLILKYPTESNSTSLQQKLILGQSKLGKLIKLVYPKLVAKRLGRRGESKYNYLGVTWNGDIIDNEITKLCEQDLPQLNDHFKNLKKGLDQQKRQQHLRRPSQHRRQSSASTAVESHKRVLYSIAPKPPFSYVEPHYKYPLKNFSPAMLLASKDVEVSDNWFGGVSQECLDSLQDVHSGVSTLISDMNSGEQFRQNHYWLLDSIISCLKDIVDCDPRENREFLNFFLVVWVQVFPRILSLDMSHDEEFVDHLRENVDVVIKHFDERMTGLPLPASDSKIFVSVLKQMLNLSDVTRSLVSAASCSPRIVQDMNVDVERLLDPTKATDAFEGNDFENVVKGCLLNSIQAFHFVPSIEGTLPTHQQMIEMIHNITTHIKLAVDQGLRMLVNHFDPAGEGLEITDQQSRHEFSENMVNIYDENILTGIITAPFPIPIVKNFFALLSNEFLKYNFNKHMDRVLESANTTFRHWWLATTHMQDYLSILGEIVSLHETLKTK